MPLPGGTSDKVGNRFEGRWTARAALDVLRETAQAIRLEPPGADGDGVEFYVRFKDRIDFHQVKRQRTGKSDWTIATLSTNGVLANFQKWLGDPRASCIFVSAHTASLLEELTEKARNTLSLEEYETYFLQSNPQRASFVAVCKAWGGLDKSKGLDLLRRIHVQPIGEEPLRRWASVEAESVLEGDQSKVLATLAEVLLDNLNKYLTSHDLWQLLAKYGYTPTLRNQPRQAAVHVQAANDAYIASRMATLIGGALIPREEAELLSTAVESHKLVLLDGIAGTGKSDVLLQFVQQLAEQSRPYLVFRLDRTTPTRRPEVLGHELGLPTSPTSPTATLAAVARGC